MVSEDLPTMDCYSGGGLLLDFPKLSGVPLLFSGDYYSVGESSCLSGRVEWLWGIHVVELAARRVTLGVQKRSCENMH